MTGDSNVHRLVNNFHPRDLDLANESAHLSRKRTSKHTYNYDDNERSNGQNYNSDDNKWEKIDIILRIYMCSK